MFKETLKVSLNGFEVFILGIYRPHRSIDDFSEILSNILAESIFSGKFVMLVGDMNINLMNSDQNVSNFVNIMQAYHFYPIISKPTRFPPNLHEAPSLIDHIWINRLNSFKSGIISLDLTDHCPIFLLYPIPNTCSNEKIEVQFRDFSDSNMLKFTEDIENFEWRSIKCENVSDYLQRFIDTLNKFYCDNFPLRKKLIGKKRLTKPWLTAQIHDLIKLKSESFIRVLKNCFLAISRAFDDKIKCLCPI